MSDSETAPENDPPPEISLQQFLICIACDPAADDEILPASTLRLILRDYRDHARRLLGTVARKLS